MSTDEKIRLGILALSAVSAVVAVHFGHVTSAYHPLLDAIGPGGSH